MVRHVPSTVIEALDIVMNGSDIERDLALELSRLDGPDRWDFLAAANRVREHFRGNTLDLCSIVNAKSGACGEDCAFCAQSARHGKNAGIYPLISADRMAESAENARSNRAKRFCIVTSGRGIEKKGDLDTIAEGIGRVRKLGLSPCATLGTLTREQLVFLKQAGLHRYHHNIETSLEYFPRICTTHTFDERVALLREARDLGLSVCSGGILGMGERMADRVSMAFTLRELDVDSVPLNFLMPMAGTPLENSRGIEPLEALHSIALFRMILPKKEIRICGGRAAGLASLHPLIFTAGADGFLIGNYLTTTGIDPAEDLAMVKTLGLTA